MSTKNNPQNLELSESVFDSTAHDLISELPKGKEQEDAWALYWKLAGLLQDNLKKKYPEYNFENF